MDVAARSTSSQQREQFVSQGRAKGMSSGQRRDCSATSTGSSSSSSSTPQWHLHIFILRVKARRIRGTQDAEHLHAIRVNLDGSLAESAVFLAVHLEVLLPSDPLLHSSTHTHVHQVSAPHSAHAE